MATHSVIKNDFTFHSVPTSTPRAVQYVYIYNCISLFCSSLVRVCHSRIHSDMFVHRAMVIWTRNATNILTYRFRAGRGDQLLQRSHRKRLLDDERALRQIRRHILVGDVLQKAVPIAEALGRQADTFAGRCARQTNHVFLNRRIDGIMRRFREHALHKNDTWRPKSAECDHLPCEEMKHHPARNLLPPRPWLHVYCGCAAIRKLLVAVSWIREKECACLVMRGCLGHTRRSRVVTRRKCLCCFVLVAVGGCPLRSTANGLGSFGFVVRET